MPMDAGAIGIRPITQQRPTGGTDSVQRREDGSSSGGFKPQTNVALKTAVDDMAGILSKISAQEKLGMEKMPREVGEIVKNILQQSFSMEATLSQGIGSTIESQRFSMEQLSVFARMLSQIGALADKGFSMELSDQTQALLTNFKNLLVSEEGGNALEPVLMSKAAFELIDSKNAEQLPQALYEILAQLAQSSAMPINQPEPSEGMQFLKQLVQYFMPRPSSEESAQGQPGQQNQPQAQQQPQQNQSPTQQFLKSMFKQLGENLAGKQSQNTQNQSPAQNQTSQSQNSGQTQNQNPAQNQQQTQPQNQNQSPIMQQMMRGQAETQQSQQQSQNTQNQGQAQNQSSQSQNSGQTQNQSPAQNQSQAQPQNQNQSPIMQQMMRGQVETQQPQQNQPQNTQNQNPAQNQTSQQPQNSGQAQNQSQTQNFGTSQQAGQSGQTQQNSQTLQGQQVTDEFLAKQQEMKSQMQLAKTALLKQPMQNNSQTMDAMKNLAQLLMKNQNITPRETVMLQNFVNNSQQMMSEGEARHLQNLLRLCQQNVPVTVQQASIQQNLPDLPRLWAFMQLCDMAGLTSRMNARAFKRAGKDVAEFANAMRQAMGGENTTVQGQRSMQVMIPLYLGENETGYPTYLSVYDENERDKETGEEKKETWVRICILTDNIGAVELTFRVYEGNQLDMRFYFSQRETAREFRNYMDDLRNSLKDSELKVADVRIGSVGEKMTSS